MSTKTFHIGDILSMTTGALVSPRHMDGVYEIAAHLVGEPVWTHQLPRVFHEVEGYLREQFPDLAEVRPPAMEGVSAEDGGAVVASWLDDMVTRFGETREVAPMRCSGRSSTSLPPWACWATWLAPPPPVSWNKAGSRTCSWTPARAPAAR